MSRVNIINPILLTDNHLIAEIHEINQIAGQFKRSLLSKKGIDKTKIKNRYSLNGGHIYFFYDKGKYLHQRYNQLKEEGIRRGFDIKKEFQNEWVYNNKLELYKNWIPLKSDFNIIINRIILRVNQKPHLYKYYRKKIDFNNYINILNNNL